MLVFRSQFVQDLSHLFAAKLRPNATAAVSHGWSPAAATTIPACSCPTTTTSFGDEHYAPCSSRPRFHRAASSLRRDAVGRIWLRRRPRCCSQPRAPLAGADGTALSVSYCVCGGLKNPFLVRVSDCRPHLRSEGDPSAAVYLFVFGFSTVEIRVDLVTVLKPVTSNGRHVRSNPTIWSIWYLGSSTIEQGKVAERNRKAYTVRGPLRGF